MPDGGCPDEVATPGNALAGDSIGREHSDGRTLYVKLDDRNKLLDRMIRCMVAVIEAVDPLAAETAARVTVNCKGVSAELDQSEDAEALPER